MAVVRFALVCLFSIALAAAASATDRVSSLGQFCNGNDNLDDTACIQAWLAAAQVTGDRDLYVPPGRYIYSGHVALHSDLHIRCAGPGASIFQNGAKADGTPAPGDLFRATSPVHNVVVENCAFDVNRGTNEYLAVISINSDSPSTNIHVRGNRVYDSAKPAPFSTPQRYYISLLGCHDCWVEDNIISEGGRIKVGRPGRRLFIRGNVVREANDNAITVVDIPGGSNDSRHILIDGNVVIDPKGVGIFFGADGPKAADLTMLAVNISVSRNIVRGDWQIACIRGIPPSRSRRMHVTENICVKLGSRPAAGIDILRPDGSHPRAQDVLIGSNTVTGEKGVLDAGGIFIRGLYKGLRIVGNSVRDIGARAVRISNGADVEDALVADNVLGGGGLVIIGNFSGQVAGNLILDAAALGMQLQTGSGQKIAASIRQNVVRQSADSCLNFNGPGTYEVDLVDNTFASCGGASPVTLFGGAALAPKFLRLHNKGDTTPHAAPTRHLTVVTKWATGPIPPGGTRTTNIAVSGAMPGNIAGAAFRGIAGEFQLSAHVVAANTVQVVLTNHTTATASPAGLLRVHVWGFD
jgi:hypothetical protein